MKAQHTQNHHTEKEPSPSAFDYDADVTEQRVKQIQEQASRFLKDGDWKIIEGYKFG